MPLLGDVFSWGRNHKGQLGDGTTTSTFTSAASAYPVAEVGASDEFTFFNEGEHTQIWRGVDVTIPASAARWRETGEVASGNDYWGVTSGEKLRWNGAQDTTQHVTGTLASNFKLHSYRWTRFEWEVQIDWELLQWGDPSTSENSIRMYLFHSNSGYVFLSRRRISGGANEVRLFGTTTGNVTWATAPSAGKFKFTNRASQLTAYMWTENPTAGWQWEWDGDTNGYPMTEDIHSPFVILQGDQYDNGGIDVEWDNLQVIGQPPVGNVATPTDTDGFAYWQQDQRYYDVPLLEFSGDTNGTTANDITRPYRTFDGSQGTFRPLLEGVSLPFYEVQSGVLDFDGISNNPNGARDLHAMVVFEEDFEVQWTINIISAPNTCCWSTRLSFLQYDDVRATATMSYEPEYGYSTSRRYRVWKNPGTGGSWQNTGNRTDAVIRFKVVHVGQTWTTYAWFNGIWNLQGSSMTQTVTHNPTVLTFRFSNWSVWPAFQADLESFSVIPSGTPEGSFYYADAPQVPAPSAADVAATELIGEHRFQDIASGVNHGIGLKSDGSVFGWGDNEYGQLGDGTLVNKSSPVSVQGDHSFVGIAPAADHNLALDADGTIFAWGRNNYGQLGLSIPPSGDRSQFGCDEYTEEELPWIFDGNESGVGQVLERATGEIFTWGSGVLGNHGQGLGFGNPNTSNPSSVLGNRSYTGMGLGSNHMLAIRSNGDVYAWGNNSDGQLGTGNLTPHDSPIQTLALPENKKAMHPGTEWMCPGCNKQGLICGGDEYSLFIGEDRRVYGMGRNSSSRGGALGDGTYIDKSSPVSVWNGGANNGFKIGEIACGSSSSYGISWSPLEDDSELPDWGNRPRGAWMEHGRLWATGQNSWGQLGDGTTTSRNSPVEVIGGPLGIDQFQANRVSGGFGHACAASIGRSGGWPYCWGLNTSGQLGDDTITNKSSPVSVGPIGIPGTFGVKDFSCGANHTCALNVEDGSAWCWGKGTSGQIGDGTITNKSTPTSVLGNRSYISIGGSGNSTCGMMENGDIYCWGAGRLAGLSGSYSSPVLLPPVSPARTPASPHFLINTSTYYNCSKVNSPRSVTGTFVAASTGLDHSLAIDRSGKVWSWGRNTRGQLGYGTTVNSDEPKAVSGLPTDKFIKVSGGRAHSCAMTELGNIWCWGDNTYSQATTGGGAYAQAFGTLYNTFESGGRTGWSDVDTDLAWVTGLGNFGTLGDGTTVNKNISSPVTVFNSYPTQYQPRWLKIGFGGNVTYGIRLGNDSIPTQLFAWGENNSGSLGSDVVGDRSTPTTMIQTGLGHLNAPPNFGFVDIGGGDFFGCALNESGAVWCWGSGAQGRLGNNSITAATTPISVFGTGGNPQSIPGPASVPGTVIRNFSVGENFVVGVDSQGKVWGWGEGNRGQLGNNSISNRSTPTSAIVTQGSFFQVTAGNEFTCGLKRGHGANSAEKQYPDVFGGTAWCWGEGQYGRLGDGTDVDKSSPVSVDYNKVYTKISAGRQFACALDHTGHPWCWGYNLVGQIGIGVTGGEYRRPQSCLGGPFSFIDIQCGTDWCVALQADGEIYHWGWEDWFINSNSPIKTTLQQGQVSFTYLSELPKLIRSIETFTDLDCGGDHNLTLNSEGYAWAWGRNLKGQVGDNTNIDKGSPVSVYGGNTFIDISAGEEHSWALKADGTICAWGEGLYGKLIPELESEENKKTPTCGTLFPFQPCLPFLPNTGNFNQSTLIDCSLNAWMWGCNSLGQLGDGTITNRSQAILVLGEKTWLDMSGGGEFTLGLDNEGRVWSWGDDSMGQLGDG